MSQDTIEMHFLNFSQACLLFTSLPKCYLIGHPFLDHRILTSPTLVSHTASHFFLIALNTKKLSWIFCLYVDCLFSFLNLRSSMKSETMLL